MSGARTPAYNGAAGNATVNPYDGSRTAYSGGMAGGVSYLTLHTSPLSIHTKAHPSALPPGTPPPAQMPTMTPLAPTPAAKPPPTTRPPPVLQPTNNLPNNLNTCSPNNSSNQTPTTPVLTMPPPQEKTCMQHPRPRQDTQMRLRQWRSRRQRLSSVGMLVMHRRLTVGSRRRQRGTGKQMERAKKGGRDMKRGRLVRRVRVMDYMESWNWALWIADREPC